MFEFYSFLVRFDNDSYRDLQGRLFTIVDAITDDPKRNEGIKSLIRKELSGWGREQSKFFRDLVWSLATETNDTDVLKYLKGQETEIRGIYKFPKLKVKK